MGCGLPPAWGVGCRVHAFLDGHGCEDVPLWRKSRDGVVRVVLVSARGQVKAWWGGGGSVFGSHSNQDESGKWKPD
jgi:hypothetical protein